jgi:hypothetical protein
VGAREMMPSDDDKKRLEKYLKIKNVGQLVVASSSAFAIFVFSLLRQYFLIFFVFVFDFFVFFYFIYFLGNKIVKLKNKLSK